MSEPSIVIFERDTALERHVRRVSLVASSNVRSITLLEQLGQQRCDLIVANLDVLSLTERHALQRHSAVQRILFHTSDARRDHFADVLAANGATNILGRRESLDVEETLVTLQKILRADYFGIEKYFGWSAQLARYGLTRASERYQSVTEVAAQLARGEVPARFIGQVETVLDEFLTNAFFNAPTNDAGDREHAHRSRSEEVELRPGRVVDVAVAWDGRRVGISVNDPFGSLAPKTLVDYLARCLQRMEVDTRSGGAGLGLATSWSALSHFVVNVEPGVRTEMIGLVDVRGSFREFAAGPKSFNLFMSGRT